jgi:hypothetical protein
VRRFRRRWTRVPARQIGDRRVVLIDPDRPSHDRFCTAAVTARRICTRYRRHANEAEQCEHNRRRREDSLRWVRSVSSAAISSGKTAESSSRCRLSAHAPAHRRRVLAVGLSQSRRPPSEDPGHRGGCRGPPPTASSPRVSVSTRMRRRLRPCHSQREVGRERVVDDGVDGHGGNVGPETLLTASSCFRR